MCQLNNVLMTAIHKLSYVCTLIEELGQSCVDFFRNVSYSPEQWVNPSSGDDSSDSVKLIELVRVLL